MENISDMVNKKAKYEIAFTTWWLLLGKIYYISWFYDVVHFEVWFSNNHM